MTRHKSLPDTRPRWDEPEKEFKTFWRGQWYSAEEWSRMAQLSLNGQKHYKNDPTYELRVRKNGSII